MAVRDLTARNAIEDRLRVKINISIHFFSNEFLGESVGVVRMDGPWTGP